MRRGRGQRAERRTQRYSQEWYRRLCQWNENGTVLHLMISPNSRDLVSPCINLGDIQIPLHAAWGKAPVGAMRHVKLFQTSSGQFYFVPAGERQKDGSIKFQDDLLPDEFDPARQENFRARLSRGNNGRFSFKLESGLRLIPLGIAQWIEAGIEGFVGKVIDLTGWPRATSFVVIPKFGFDNIGMTDAVGRKPDENVRVKKAQERAIAHEKTIGIIRIAAGDDFLPIAATVVLGIASDAKLTREIIKFASKRRMKELQSGDEFVATPIGLVEKERMVTACQDARELLYHLVDQGVGSFAAQADEDDTNGDRHDQEAPPGPEIISCQVCGEKNRVDSNKGPRELAVCGKCRLSLFPVNHWAEEVALQAIEEGYQGSKIGGVDALEELLRANFDFLKQLSNNGSLNERASVGAEKLGSTKIDGRRVATAAEKVWCVRLKADRTKQRKPAS